MTQPIIEWLDASRDLEGVLAVDRLSFARPWTREMYEGDLQNAGVSFIAVLRLPGCPVAGYCSFWVVLDEIHINNVAVHPDFRRAGHGRALVDFVTEQARGRGASRVLLEVRRSNEPARQLYLTMGFEQIGVRSKYYEHPVEDALVLARNLRNLESNPDA